MDFKELSRVSQGTIKELQHEKLELRKNINILSKTIGNYSTPYFVILTIVDFIILFIFIFLLLI